MTKTQKTEADHIAETRAKLLEAAVPHVVFDGWSDATFAAAVAESGVDAGLAAQACPRKGLDLAVAYHRQGDREMLAAMDEADLAAMRYSERVALALRARLDAADRELVRRGSALFALPHHAAEGAGLIWETSSAIWDALGDSSRDVNWYSKRAMLSAVYSSAVLFWLGDTSEESAATSDFIDRRIADVMKIETTKAKLRENPLSKAFMAGPGRLLDLVKAPDTAVQSDLPGYVAPKS
ncbi:COQ9 family protein [Neptunicoccus cionae]|uniref:COQ9 family protein n=1 Tax=Neptunicoccus cionae TaxID=2035344 RepID=UPI000C77594A|nr:COQ9 family protein [Amylibacter cionae]PLS23276.1 COQ9 family protein [Amylibacter cionae]